MFLDFMEAMSLRSCLKVTCSRASACIFEIRASCLIDFFGLGLVDLLLSQAVYCPSVSSICGLLIFSIMSLRDSTIFSKICLYYLMIFLVFSLSGILSNISSSSSSQQMRLLKQSGRSFTQALMESSSSVGSVRFSQQERQQAKQQTLLSISSQMRLKIRCYFTLEQVRKSSYSMVMIFVPVGMSFFAKIPLPIFFVLRIYMYSCSITITIFDYNNNGLPF